jgi:hypothetical protein
MGQHHEDVRTRLIQKYKVKTKSQCSKHRGDNRGHGNKINNVSQ